MKRCIITLVLVLLATPLWAQLYSYRDKNGKLVITDRPIREKGYKLVDTYIPKRVRDKQVKDESRRLRDNRIGKSRNKRILKQSQLRGLVVPIAKSLSVDPGLVMAVIKIESSGNARAKSHKGAIGLMQLMPETAKRFGVNNPWDPRQNIKGGVRYLQYLLSYFEGNVNYVLAAYNAGENAVDRHGGIPPYKETRNYIRKIRKVYDKKTLSYTRIAKYRSPLVAGGKITRNDAVASSE